VDAAAPPVQLSCKDGLPIQWQIRTSSRPFVLRTEPNACLAAVGASDGTAIVGQACGGGQNQRWHLKSADWSSYDEHFYVINENSSLCLDIPHGDPSIGIPLNQYHCKDGVNQRWFFRHSDRGWALVNLATNKPIGLAASSGGSPPPFEQVEYDETHAAMFTVAF